MNEKKRKTKQREWQNKPLQFVSWYLFLKKKLARRSNGTREKKQENDQRFADRRTREGTRKTENKLEFICVLYGVSAAAFLI